MSNFGFKGDAQQGRSNVTVDGITVVAQFDLYKYGGILVGAGNAVHVTPGTGATFTITGALTDTQLRATPVPISGALTDTELRAADVKVSLDGELVGIESKYDDTTSAQPRIDKSTFTLQTIDYAHHEIHSGSHFIAFHNATGKNDGQTINIYIKTPDTTEYCHLIIEWSASGAAYARIREAPTVTSDTGTNGNSVINSNRNSAHTSTVVDNAASPAADKYGKDVTVSAAGTIIWEEFAGAAKSFGGGGRNDMEIILKRNTEYVFEIESDASGLTLGVTLEWYEHTDKA